MYSSITSILTKGKRLVRCQHNYLPVKLISRDFCIVKAFASAVVGASLEEEVEDVQPPGDSSTANQNLYEVIGTLSDQTNEKPSWISEIIPVSSCTII